MEEEKKGRKLVSSSMVDLKAELFRKQEEFKKQKEKSVGFVNAKKYNKDTKSSIWNKQNSGVLARAQKDLVDREKDVEEEEVLAKSRRILEQKSKVYDSITSSSTIPEEDGSEFYLVDFQKKAIDALVEEREAKRRLNEQKEEYDGERKEQTNEIPEASCPEDEWVDFVDSLGRDRRCMKKDLSLLMKKDQDLALAQAKKSQALENRSYDLETPGSSLNERSTKATSNTLPHLMSTDMHRELMRQKWENEARELLDKGQDEVHYSNIQFDEIRAHGVGFYQFSKDHSKRQEELDKLKELREETKNQQTSKEKIKDKRKAMLEARLAKVRQRRKLKAGVDEHNEPLEDKNDTDHIGPKLNEAVSSTRTKEDIQKEEETKEAEEKRKNYVREWDEDKVKGNDWGSKNYVTARRKERENEFAPPSLYFEQNTKTKSYKPGGLSNSDRLKRLKDSISTSSEKEGKNPPKDNNEQPALPSRLSSEDNTRVNNSDSFGSIPLPEEFPFSHCDEHTVQDQTPVSAGHLLCGPQASFNTTEYQQSQNDVAAWQSYSGQYASIGRSLDLWNQKQDNVLPQQFYQKEQQPQNWYPMQPVGQYFQPSSQHNYQGAQVFNPTQSAQFHPQNQSYSQYKYDSSFSSTSNESLKVPNSIKQSSKQDPPASSAADEPSAPKKPKVPKPLVVDMRFMNNFDTASINPEPGRVPDVGGVPYKPGTFSKYRPHGVDGTSDNTDRPSVGQNKTGVEGQDGAQISGGPLIYTKEQLERQQQELEEQGENSSQVLSDDDRKLQEFLSSVRSSTK
ncbi:hypothetical protein EGW08_001457 [Elysia chlorotica]|uniref:CCDC174 alpha/beta GRSR domain-containing protein n=1 Tax=Elysia chlorotica TaxID=188477 RepID=A0A3S1CEU0_ELYCH|nr:hypothetical protein EGW08_001457 [Elysia chlorotica]